MKLLVNHLAELSLNRLRQDMITYDRLIRAGIYSQVRCAGFKREILYRSWLYQLATLIYVKTGAKFPLKPF